MPQIHLTDLALRTLRPNGKQTDYYCTQTARFGVRINPSGRKSFFCFAGQPRRRVSLGIYPVMSLKDARKHASTLIHSPKPSRPSDIFSDIVQAYLKTYVEVTYRPRTAYLTRRHLESPHCKPIAHLPLNDIKPTHLTAIFDSLAPSEANHLFGVLRTFFNWSERRDLVDASPLRKLLKPHKEASRERTLSDDELRAIWKSADDTDYCKVVKLLILTGQRRGEIAALKREWVGFDRITFPKEVTKNGVEHSVPITTSQRLLIGNATHSGHVFPARSGDGCINGWGKHKAAFDKLCGVRGWTLHDLRRTFSTIHARIGTPPHVTEAILNHRTGVRSPLQRIYDRHDYFLQMRQAISNYELELKRIIAGTTSG